MPPDHVERRNPIALQFESREFTFVRDNCALYTGPKVSRIHGPATRSLSSWGQAVPYVGRLDGCQESSIDHQRRSLGHTGVPYARIPSSEALLTARCGVCFVGRFFIPSHPTSAGWRAVQSALAACDGIS